MSQMMFLHQCNGVKCCQPPTRQPTGGDVIDLSSTPSPPPSANLSTSLQFSTWGTTSGRSFCTKSSNDSSYCDTPTLQDEVRKGKINFDDPDDGGDGKTPSPGMGIRDGVVYVNVGSGDVCKKGSKKKGGAEVGLEWLNGPSKINRDLHEEAKDCDERLTKRNRDKKMKDVLEEYLEKVFEGRMKPPVTWSNRLQTTAGLTRLKKIGDRRTSSIELSSKVITTVGRLR